MSLRLPDPSCDLAQSFTVKNNHGLKLGEKSKLLGLHGNKEKEKGKPWISSRCGKVGWAQGPGA